MAPTGASITDLEQKIPKVRLSPKCKLICELSAWCAPRARKSLNNLRIITGNAGTDCCMCSARALRRQSRYGDIYFWTWEKEFSFFGAAALRSIIHEYYLHLICNDNDWLQREAVRSSTALQQPVWSFIDWFAKEKWKCVEFPLSWC